MAERYWSLSLGENIPSAVTEGAASDPAEAIELRVTYDASGVDKRSVIVALDVLKARILQDTWPPV